MDEVSSDRVGKLIQGMSVENVLKVWNEADDGEKDKYLPKMAKKLRNLAIAHPERYKKVIETKAGKEIMANLESIFQKNQDVAKEWEASDAENPE